MAFSPVAPLEIGRRKLFSPIDTYRLDHWLQGQVSEEVRDQVVSGHAVPAISLLMASKNP